MTELQKGGNGAVPGAAAQVTVAWTAPPGVEADATAYLLTAAGKVRGDQDMVFYNQPEGAGGAVRLTAQGNPAAFFADLPKMPAEIARILFCLTLDGGARFGVLADARIRVESGGAALSFRPDRAGAIEAAMILGELYRRDGGWKFRAVGQGFDGGLAPLARSFGIMVDEAAPAPPPAPAATSVSLEKRVADKAPQLVNLAKTAAVSLEKNRLATAKAQVALVLDTTGSMTQRYLTGTVQAVVDRILPLAVHFDDDGALDVWAYAEKPGRLTPITLDNVRDYIAREGGGWRKWPLGGRYNDEPAVIRPLMDAYARSALPTYIVFISDGGVSRNREIEALLREAASLPIFWQFVGIGGRNYGVFEKLDTMAGRVVDNCNFFALDDLSDVTDAELYDRLLGEFPMWLQEARRAGVLR
jgi:stress response protein SCP2